MEKQYLVIVESPTKAKTIRKFLPKNFTVEASMGHIRDLPQSAADIPAKYKKEPWAKETGINCDNKFEPLYIVPKDKTKIISTLKEKLKNADELYLATDEDREGESISWHLIELLKPKCPVKRMVFHEITKPAIEKALKNTRTVDDKLVRAQEARRILDRIVGYTLSPVLWKKVTYGLSAGRVQSAALRIMVERERERMRFKKANYFDLSAKLNFEGKEFEATLISVGEKRVAQGKDFNETTGALNAEKDMIVLAASEAKSLAESLQTATWQVQSIEEKQSTAKPQPPFITSTLQQAGNRKLGLSARDVMRVAQNLYEQGFITYMRTDSPTLSQEALSATRDIIKSTYGGEYLSNEPRQYSAKSKSAQEAHEAIRPAGTFLPPDKTGLTNRELDIYTLIWQRTLASQMTDAKKSSMSVRIAAQNTLFNATGTKIVFPGFMKAYDEALESGDASWGSDVLLPPMKTGDKPKLVKVTPDAHETKPPARYNEASIVQAMEKAGIGRPSTYASVISTLFDKKYVTKSNNAIVPSFTGFAVVQLLEKHFDNFVNLDFTSKMEEDLDSIAEGNLDHLDYLGKFWFGPNGLKQLVEKKIKQIDPKDSRSITLPQLGKELEIRIGRFGPYLSQTDLKDEEGVFASIPEGIAPADLTLDESKQILETKAKGPESIGKYPPNGDDIYVMTGRFGAYVQVGKQVEGSKEKPRRASIPKEQDLKTLTLEQALKYLSLPRDLGKFPDNGEMITVYDGRFGPYVKCGSDMRSLKKTDDKYTVALQRAIELLREEKRGRFGAKLLKQLGQHPENGKDMGVYEGKFGPYIKCGTVSASLPKDLDPAQVTIETALPLLAAKMTAGKTKVKTGAAKANVAVKKAKAAPRANAKT
ncbi:MAG: type I DNA topoisomerase [bacterium]